MSFLSRLIGKNNDEANGAVAANADAAATAECRHPHLAPRWGNAEDMGDYSRATTFECSLCKEQLSPTEAAAIEAERALD